MTGHPFHFFYTCDLGAGETRVEWRPDAFRPSAEEIRLTGESWERLASRANRDGGSLYDGPLCRLASWSAGPDGLLLRLEGVSYRFLAAMHFDENSPLAALPAHRKANGLSVCSVAETSDGRLALQLRGFRAFREPGKWHVCAGQMEPRFAGPRGTPCPFEAMRRELQFELGVGQSELVSLRLLGLFVDAGTGQPECAFSSLLDIDSTELGKKAASAKEADETERLRFLDASPAAVEQFLEGPDRIAPSGRAALSRWADWKTRRR